MVKVTPRNGSAKWIRKSTRLAIYIRDGFRCQYCGTDLRNAEPRDITLDHLKPYTTGGSHHATNLVTACNRCNCSRGAKPWRQFAPAGAVARIERTVRRVLNRKLALAIVRGDVHPTELAD